jgi:hypothetical protein
MLGVKSSACVRCNMRVLYGDTRSFGASVDAARDEFEATMRERFDAVRCSRCLQVACAVVRPLCKCMSSCARACMSVCDSQRSRTAIPACGLDCSPGWSCLSAPTDPLTSRSSTRALWSTRRWGSTRSSCLRWRRATSRRCSVVYRCIAASSVIRFTPYVARAAVLCDASPPTQCCSLTRMNDVCVPAHARRDETSSRGGSADPNPSPARTNNTHNCRTWWCGGHRGGRDSNCCCGRRRSSLLQKVMVLVRCGLPHGFPCRAHALLAVFCTEQGLARVKIPLQRVYARWTPPQPAPDVAHVHALDREAVPHAVSSAPRRPPDDRRHRVRVYTAGTCRRSAAALCVAVLLHFHRCFGRAGAPRSRTRHLRH